MDVTIDGVTTKSATGGVFIGDAFPSTESISEIRADGVLANAEFGNPGQIVVTTKGGANTLHGSGFWYYQNSAFDAIAYTYPITKTKPSVTGNTFGGSAGGPVVIPHFYNGHNKTFFFGAYEGWRHPAQQTINEVVPSTLMKKGDFSKYIEPDGKGGNSFTGLTDPFTGGSYGTKITATLSPDRPQHPQAVLSRSKRRRSHHLHRQRRGQLSGQCGRQRPLQPVRRARRPVLRLQPEVPDLGQVHLEELSHQPARDCSTFPRS